MRAAFLGVLFALALFAQERTGVLEVLVRNSLTGAPLPGVEVRAANQKQQTSSAGIARFDGLAPGNIEVRIQKQGYVDSNYPSMPTQAARVKASGEAERLTIDLVPTGAIEGHVYGEDGKGLKGVLLYADRGGHSSPFAVSEVDGSFKLDLLEPDRYRLLLRSPYALRKETGYPPAEYYPGEVIVAAGVTQGGFDIRLKRVPLIEVRGRALDSQTHEPFAGRAEIVPDNGPADGVRIDLKPDGGFAFNLIPPGRYRLLFYRENRRDAMAFAVPVDAGEGGVRDFLALVPRATTITGRVVAPREKLAAFAPLTVMAISGGSGDSHPVDPDGNFSIEGAMPGPIGLQLMAGRILQARQWYVAEIRSGSTIWPNGRVTVNEGANDPIEIVLGLDAAQISGQAPPGARVKVSGETQAVQNASLDGTFSVAGLKPGDYTVSVAGCEAKAVKLSLGPSEKRAVMLERCN